MYVKRVKRKCSVRGCRNTDCFAISRTREMGNSVIICTECLEDALQAATELPQGVVSNARRSAVRVGQEPEAVATEAEAETTKAEAVATEADTAEPQETTEAENKAVQCPGCGKSFASERGLRTHAKHCTGQKG